MNESAVKYTRKHTISKKITILILNNYKIQVMQ